MKQTYQLETITPVHIGTGETLNHIDGYYANGRWHRIDVDKVLAHPAADINALTSAMGRREFRWQQYLQGRNMDPEEFSAYSLPCPQSPETNDIREAITILGNRPYIPGSTLKGAIRTALLSEFIDRDDAHFKKNLEYLIGLAKQRPRGNPRRETPARKMEQDILGINPNKDLLRALHVSDTTPLESESLEIGMAWTVTLNQNNQLVQKVEGNREYKNFVQQIQTKKRLTFTLKIDELLFREREMKRLEFNGLQQEVLHDIAEVCRSATNYLMDIELEFFQKYRFSEMANLYDRLIQLNNDLPEGAFLLQIGWGIGYHANTVTSLFTNDTESPEYLSMDLRERFKLGESRSRRGQYDDREFPKTRRILYRGQNPFAPLGWVKISPLKDE